MGKHVRHRHIHPLWIVAGVVVSAVTVGAYGLWPREAASAPSGEDDSPASSQLDPRPPIVPPTVVQEVSLPRPAIRKAPRAARKPVTRRRSVKSVVLSRSSRLVRFARAQIHKRYEWGGNGPNAWDCSGLTRAAYAHVGIHLPRTSQAQSTVGVRIRLSELRPGDLLFWGPAGESHHVAIYVGHGEYVAAENPRAGVVIRTLSFFRPDFARRVL